MKIKRFDGMVIKQEKSNKVLQDIANKIIDLCHDLNTAEKYKVINALHIGLIKTIKDANSIIIEKEKEK